MQEAAVHREAPLCRFRADITVPLLELQEGIWHKLWADLQGMYPSPLAMSPQIHSLLTVFTRSQLRASNTARESQNCTSRIMVLYGSSATIAARSHANTEYVSAVLIHDLPGTQRTS